MIFHRHPAHRPFAHRMGNREHHRKERYRESGSNETLKKTAARRGEKCRESALEHSGTNECRLKQRGTARCFGNSEKKLTIRVRIAESANYPIVAIHFHRKAQAVQLPPQGKIPWNEADQDRKDAKQEGITRRSVLLLMTNHVLALTSG